MPQFSAHESTSLEKDVDLKGKLIKTNSKEIDELYDIQKCADWIKLNGFQKVCLQFPDHLLPDSSDVALKLQNILGQPLYILGDTAYESCCIDYVAAAHINADAIIHFGPICFSKTSENVPYLNVYEKRPLNVLDLEASIAQNWNHSTEDCLVLLLDDGFIHCHDAICKLFENWKNLEVHTIKEELSSFDNKIVVFVGNNERKLINIDLNFKPKSLFCFDPNKNPPTITPFQPDLKIIKRRYFVIEKIRDANTIGIVIGTLAVKNYLKVIERVKKLAAFCGKKYYLISVGKPTVAKLANLGEIDIYVMITCAMNEIYDSRDFYKPVVTPYDVEMALNSNLSDLQFTYDCNGYLKNLGDIDNLKRNDNETDVSLLTGQLRSNRSDISVKMMEDGETKPDLQIALKTEGTLALNSHFGAGFLSERSWKGLEQNLGQAEVKLAEEGRRGIAQGYENENF